MSGDALGRFNLGERLTRFDHVADGRQLNEDDVAELALRVVGDAHPHGVGRDDLYPFVFGRVPQIVGNSALTTGSVPFVVGTRQYHGICRTACDIRPSGSRRPGIDDQGAGSAYVASRDPGLPHHQDCLIPVQEEGPQVHADPPDQERPADRIAHRTTTESSWPASNQGNAPHQRESRALPM